MHIYIYIYTYIYVHIDRYMYMLPALVRLELVQLLRGPPSVSRPIA